MSLIAYFVAGIAAGVLYFLTLQKSTGVFAAGGRLTTVIGLGVIRFAVLGVLLTLAAREGAIPLLIMTLGLLLGRAAILHRVRASSS